ncbi:restriction endonuclease [Halorubrum halophilum]|uniref:restriction endonuclease n=1 Tax=Halorubrum halophilum TaxID=413816 RepID=UPI0006797720|nr:restriction endonuclease [Halorubrum halophilum]
MDPYEFEHFVADLWERMGWETDVSAAAVDEGVDVIARKQTPYEQTTLIQAKRYGPNTTVGSPDIQQYASLDQQYTGVDKVVVVTTNEFTSQARDLAERLNVKLINGDTLAELVVEHDGLDLVDEYIGFVTTVDHEDDSETPDQVGTEGNAERQNTATATPAADTMNHLGSVPSTIWQKIIIAAIPGWIIAFFGVEVLPTALWGILFFTVWLGLPFALYLDARHIRKSTDWPQYWWAYVVTALIWFLAIVPAGLYLWRRRSLDESTTAESASSHATDAETTETATPGDTESEPSEGAADRTARSPREPDDASSVEHVPDRVDIEYDGEQYYAQRTTSPDGEYTAAYQDGRSGPGQGESRPGRVFLFEGDELCFTTDIDRPNACAVANDGTVAVVDWKDWGDTLSGTFHVFNRSGHRFVKHDFDSNIGPVAITPDGAYAATSTLNPDCSTYLFDVDAGERLLRHENQHGNVNHLEFVKRDNTWMLRLGEPDDDSAYGIDLGGHVVWKSEGVKRQERLEDLIERSEESDLREAVVLLEEAMGLASEDYEQRNVAQQLAETHWNLAKTVSQEHGPTDEWWDHLDQAAQYYRETLPRYAGKQGLAKVKRKQGKQHLDDGNEAAARECFETIADLEDEYDVQLLTDADERRLGKLQ